mgnify:CR=1 FL=1
MLSGILRSERFPNDIYPRLQLMIKDVNSLINHADFSFQRLGLYPGIAALGLINNRAERDRKDLLGGCCGFHARDVDRKYLWHELFDHARAALEIRLPVCHRLDVALFGAYDLVLPIQEVVIKTVRFDFGFIFVGRVFLPFQKVVPETGEK